MLNQRMKDYLERLVLFGLVAFALFSNVKLIVSNYKLNARVREAQTELDSKENQNKQLSLLVYYYQSSQYQEVEARRRLQMKKPDETVLLVKGLTPAKENIDLDPTSFEVASEASSSQQSNFSKWWGYFFK